MRYFVGVLTLVMLSSCFGCATTAPSLSEDQSLSVAGHAGAQNNMGVRYQFGDGVAQDHGKAVLYYQKAADQDLACAKTNLGYMYDLGLGVAEDNEKAISLYTEAAEAGDPRGMINLAVMYAHGDHIEQSFEKAYFWLEIARFYTQLSPDHQAKWRARGLQDEVKASLSQEQIKTGNKLASEWIEKHRNPQNVSK